jgi:hypothetical protein
LLRRDAEADAVQYFLGDGRERKRDKDVNCLHSSRSNGTLLHERVSMCVSF